MSCAYPLTAAGAYGPLLSGNSNADGMITYSHPGIGYPTIPQPFFAGNLSFGLYNQSGVDYGGDCAGSQVRIFISTSNTGSLVVDTRQYGVATARPVGLTLYHDVAGVQTAYSYQSGVAGDVFTFSVPGTVGDCLWWLAISDGPAPICGGKWGFAGYTWTPPVAPVADFTATPLVGGAPLSVAFTDTSTDAPTSWAWDFGDGATSTLQNPTHDYLAPGNYTVELVATNAVGSDTETKADYVHVYEAYELDVYAINAPGNTITFLGTLDDATDRAVKIELDGTGAGQFSINRYSANATAAMLATGNLIKVRIPRISNDYIFSYLLEEGTFQLVSTDEKGGEVITRGGRGGLSYWDRAIWMSRGFIVPWWSPLWGTPPAGSLGHVVYQPGTYYRYTVVGNAITAVSKFTTKTGFAAYWNAVKYATRTGHANLTTIHLTTTDDIPVAWGGGVDASVISSYPVPDAVARVMRELGSPYGTVVDDVDLRAALTRAGISFGAVVNGVDVDAYMTLGSALVSHVGQWLHPYDVGVTNVRASFIPADSALVTDISPDTPGVVLKHMFDEANAVDRPQQPIPLMTIDFDDTLDSNGDPWTTTDALAGMKVDVDEQNLTTVGKLLGTGVIDVQMDPNLGFHAYNSYGRDLTGGAFGAGVVRFVKGVNIADNLTRKTTDGPVATFTEVQGRDGVYSSAELADAATRVARETSTKGDSTDVAALAALGLADLEARLIQSDAIRFNVAVGEDPDDGLYLPGPPGSNGHYWVGDVATLHTGTGEQDFNNEPERIYAITISHDEAGNLKVINDAASGYAKRPGQYSGSAAPTGGGGGSSSSTTPAPDLSGVQALMDKGLPDGYASLDESGRVPLTQLPSLSAWSGPPGWDGEDAEPFMIPGPPGITGATGLPGSGGSGSGSMGPPGLDGLDADDFMIPGPPGPAGAAGAASTAFIGCGVYHTGTQVLNTGGEAVIACAAEAFDTDGFHSTSVNNERITVPAGLGGKYLVSLAVESASASGTYNYMIVRRIGSVASTVMTVPAAVASGVPYASWRGSVVLDLVAGDYLELKGVAVTSTTIKSGDVGQPILSIVKLDSGKVGAGIGGRATNTAATSIPSGVDTAVPFATEDFDTDGFHDTVTNNTRFTVPAGLGGKYLVNASAMFATTASTADKSSYILVTKAAGGVYAAGIYNTTEIGTAALASTGVLDLVPGDYVQFVISQSTGGALLLNSTDTGRNVLSIMRLDSGSGSAPTYVEAPCSADTTVSGANTPTDITGCSMVLGAGDWMVQGQVHTKSPAGSYVLVSITNGSNAHLRQASIKAQITGGVSNNGQATLSIGAVKVAGGTTVKLRIQADGTTTAALKNIDVVDTVIWATRVA